jgi:L-2-hydroxyglutarate oxidase
VTEFDFTIIGGGIVGVSTALALKKRYPDADIALIEKGTFLSLHQTGHNSGVIHAGVYYQPGSLKAGFCKRGSALTMSFCREHNLPFKQCGKLLVATDEVEFDRMQALEKRCVLNGITTHRINKKLLHEMEPNITGTGALLIPDTAITDYKRITRKMADLFLSSKGVIKTGRHVTFIKEKKDMVVIYAGTNQVHTKYLIVCGGLQADRIAKMMNIDIDFRIIPFRGEYYQLQKHHSNIVSRLIYPIPDPDLPFLGVHLTPMVDGSVTVGPNAVLGWKKEGYDQFNFNMKDTMGMLSFPGFWHLVRQI